MLNCFHLNPGTGGKGAFNGGDGIVRELLFRKSLQLSLLTERRVFSPYGLKGKVAQWPCKVIIVGCEAHSVDSRKLIQPARPFPCITC